MMFVSTVKRCFVNSFYNARALVSDNVVTNVKVGFRVFRGQR